MRDGRVWSPLARSAPSAGQLAFRELAPEPESGVRALNPALRASPPEPAAEPLEPKAWALNTAEHLLRYEGNRQAYAELLRRAHRYVRAGARMYTRTAEGRLEAVCFVLDRAAFAPSVGSGGVVLCELERWG